MTIQEILQGQGIGEGTIKTILEAMKTNKIFTASEENLDVRYGKLKTDHDGVKQQLTEAQALIETMKKDTQGQETLQGKITAYEQQIEKLNTALIQEKINAAIKVGLLASKAKDVDYLTYKLKEKLKAESRTLTLDESGAIKGWNEELTGLKTQLPGQFEQGSGDDGKKILGPNSLKGGDGNEPVTTRERFQRMTYEERVALKQKNEQLYKQLAK